ncbi:MAG TPA: STAS domain-containing protein [bacterium]|nr:STAS domain-containing protein [bacterium]
MSPGQEATGDNNTDARNILDCRLEERHGATVVHVSGEADLGAHDVLGDALAVAFDLGKPVILHFHDLTYVDSKGISLLLRCQQRAVTASLRLVIANPSRIVRRVLDTLELDEVLPVFSSVEVALQVVDGRR